MSKPAFVGMCVAAGKTCKRCGVEKLRSEFYAKPRAADRLFGVCKLCWNQYMAKQRVIKAVEIKAYQQKRLKIPSVLKNHSDKVAMWRAKHPERAIAHNILNEAIRHGRVQKWPVCAVPECSCTRVIGHHADYSLPLGVVWLCQFHHIQAHAIVANA